MEESAELRSENNRVIISNTREGTPAQKIGLQENDAILKVDGEDMEGKSISYVVSKVRGEVGTDVNPEQSNVVHRARSKDYSS